MLDGAEQETYKKVKAERPGLGRDQVMSEVREMWRRKKEGSLDELGAGLEGLILE
jgi:hypothetical protein